MPFGCFRAYKVSDTFPRRRTATRGQQSASRRGTTTCRVIVAQHDYLLFRFVEKSKVHYEKQIIKMKERIRALEDAITIAQAAESNEPHPLLSAQWRLEDESDEEPEDESEDHAVEDPGPEALIQSFGTLHVNERERTMRFFGPMGTPEVRRSPSRRRSAQTYSLRSVEPPCGTFLHVCDVDSTHWHRERVPRVHQTRHQSAGTTRSLTSCL